jgi:hypothetical protein
MKETLELNLLVEISKLLKKYGVKSFENLAVQLSKPELTETIASILVKTAETAKEQPSVPVKKPEQLEPSAYRQKLLDLEKTESEKSALLIKLYDDLITKAILPNMGDIESFALANDIPVKKASSRHKTVISFVDNFLSLPLEKAKELIATIPPLSRPDNRSLESWSDIILHSKKKSKASAEE